MAILRHVATGRFLTSLWSAGLFAVHLQSWGQLDPDSVPTAQDYTLHVWQRDDGLPHNSVSAIVQTRDGYLWIGTYEGLARYDGARFVRYTRDDTPGLASDRIDALEADVHGNLWVGLERGGVLRWEAGGFHPLAPLGAYTNRIHTLSSGGADMLWVGLSQGRILRWQEGSWSTFGADRVPAARGRMLCQMDTDGRLWFVGENSYGYLEDNTWVPLATNLTSLCHLATRRDGGVWIASGRELIQYSSSLQHATVGDLAPLGFSGSLQVLYEDSEGVLWLGTKGNGLYRFADGRLTRIPTSHDFILAICEDREGDVWVGTWGGGLNRIRPRVLKVFGTAQGLPKSLVVSLGEDVDGSLWIATRNAPPVSLSPDRERVILHPEAWISPFVSTLWPDRSRGIWLAAERNGFCHWTEGDCQPNRLRGRFITSLYQDSDTNLWIGTLRGGLFQWRDAQATPVAGDPDMLEITVITEDPEGTLWVGTQTGSMHRRQPGESKFTRFAIAPGPPGRKIQAIYADEPGTLWVGTRGAGVFRFQDETATGITEAQGLPDDDIRQILADDMGRLWFGSASGLFRANRSDLEAVVDGREAVVECLSYGASYDLANYEFQEGFRNAMCRTRDGKLWFATTRGAVELDPHSDISRREPPPVHIETLLVDGQAIPVQAGQRVKIPPASGRVEIRYTAPSFAAPENVRFRHRLDSLDAEWVEAGAERSVTYFRIPPGEYLFRVIARGSGGRWNRVGASMRLTIQPTLWQSTWFHVVLFGGAFLLTGMGVRFVALRRVQRRMQKLEQAQVLEKERRRIARDMHDDLGASLTRLGLLSEQARKGARQDRDTQTRLERISVTARELAHTLDQIVWTVNPRNDTLERVIGYLSQYTLDYLEPTGIALTQELPEGDRGDRINSHVRHEMFLTYKEALNNAVKHSGARAVALEMRVTADRLVVCLADDGTGFSPDDSMGKGEGLGSLQQRLANVGGQCEVRSRPGGGTVVTLLIPLLRGRTE